MVRAVYRIVAVAALVAWGGAARAADVPPGVDRAAQPVVAEPGPEIYYLEDEAGRLVPVPGFRYRDFLELFRLREGLPAALEPPAAVLEDLVVQCDLTNVDTAAGSCPATIEAVVRQTRSGWTPLKLGLDGLVLSAAPRHEGPGRVVVDADPDGGYRGWFDAPADGGDVRHVVALEGAVPIDVAESSDTLALRLPMATASTVKIRTARAAPEVAVLPPPPGRPTVTPDVGGTSIVSIAGAAGAVRVRLAAAGARDAMWEAVPQATVESVVRIDGRSALTDAAIRLENLAPGTDTIRVTLPPRTVLRGVRPPATLVARGGTAESPTATIAIDGGRDGRAVAELECERPVDPGDGGAVETIGFAVAEVESWRQWGRVSLVVEGDWRAEWTDRPGVRRVDPPPAARRPGFVAAFAYDALPASLPVRVRPRVSRVVVEPEYRFDVGAARVALEARLRVLARGAPATTLVLDVDPGFEIDDVGPPGIVDVAGVTSAGGRVTIPFLQPLAGDAVVEVRGSRRIDRDAAELSWQMPVPRADVVARATVVVASDSDIELVPDAAASVGLVRQTGGGRGRQEEEGTLVYRMDGGRGTFAAARRFLTRRVDADVAVRARIDAAAIDVEETIRLDVAHVPLEFVELAVPVEVLATATLEVRQGGVALEPFVAAPPAGATPDAGPTSPPQILRAVLAEPLLGSGVIVVGYRLPAPFVPAETTVAAELPLVLPEDVRIERQTAAITAVDQFTVDVRGDGWRTELGGDDASRAWTATQPLGALPLAIAERQRAVVEAVVEAAWLRTHLLADRREDIATYVVSGGGDAVGIAVPAGAGTVSCSVTCDGQPLPATRDATAAFAVTLPRGAAGRRRVLEVRTTAARPSGWAAIGARLGLPERLRLDPPAFGAGVAERRFFWEITTRPDEHVLGAPPSWTAQQRWRWSRFGFERPAAVDAAALTAWIDASAGTAAAAPAEPEAVAARVVFSGLGAPGSALLWLVPSWCVVLVASGMTLAAGLACVYVAAARRASVVVPVLAAIAVGTAALPDLAPLAARAALPGVALSILAWILRGLVDREPRAAVVRRPVTVSASSLTRIAAPPSLVVGSSFEHEGSVTAGGAST